MLKAMGPNSQHLTGRILSFFLGEYFTDALRNTLVIVLPGSFLFIKGYPNAAIGIGVGALLISLTDLPGNRSAKLRTAIHSNIIFFLTALVISSSTGKPWLTAAVFFLLTFLLSMLSIFGTRSALTGTMAIILSTFTLGLDPQDPVLFSGYILLGGLWYYMVSLIQISVWPYKYLHHAIFECLISTSDFLKAKAKCYDPGIALTECYQQSITLHARVSEKQDLVRNLLLSDKYAMDPSNMNGQRLLRVAQGAIALYEQVTAIHYDYNTVRTVLQPCGGLPAISRLIALLAEELKILGGGFLRPLKSESRFTSQLEFKALLINLSNISMVADKQVSEMISKLVLNVKDIEAQITNINSARAVPQQNPGPEARAEHYNAFLSAKSFGPAFFREQFSLKSMAFRFSLRLGLSFLVAYLVILLFPSERYSYWMLLTIVIVARPRFGLTWKRNKERLWGTLAGAMIGVFLLLTVKQASVLLIVAGFLLLLFFTFNRIRYALSVMCITPAVIICLSLYHGHADIILSERIYYTLGGCMIAFAGLYLFPVWEKNQLKPLTRDVIQTNINFMEEVIKRGKGLIAAGAPVSGLARKNAHLALARFSEALQFMIMEPGSNNIGIDCLQAIQVLNYRINAVITSLYLSEEPIFLLGLNAKLGDQVLMELRQNLSGGGNVDQSALAEGNEAGVPQLYLLLALSKELKASLLKFSGLAEGQA